MLPCRYQTWQSACIWRELTVKIIFCIKFCVWAAQDKEHIGGSRGICHHLIRKDWNVKCLTLQIESLFFLLLHNPGWHSETPVSVLLLTKIKCAGGWTMRRITTLAASHCLFFWECPHRGCPEIYKVSPSTSHWYKHLVFFRWGPTHYVPYSNQSFPLKLITQSNTLHNTLMAWRCSTINVLYCSTANILDLNFFKS